MIITHQNNFKNPPSWPATYKEYLDGLPWIKVITIYGGDEPNEDTKQTLSNTGNYQYIQVSDYYEHLPEKIIAGIKHIFTQWPTVKGIFKIDDDVEIINMPGFIINAINLIANNTQYAGITTSVSYNSSKHHIGKCQDKTLNITLPLNPNIKYCGGPLYFLGAASIRLIGTSTEYSINTIYEDNLMGYILYTFGKITPIHCELYHDLPSLVKHRIRPANKVVAIHNAEHNNKLLSAYFRRFNLPQEPHKAQHEQTLGKEEEQELNRFQDEWQNKLPEISKHPNISDVISNAGNDTNLQPEHNIVKYQPINNSYIISRKMYYLLHKNKISNYITIHGGLCNNLFQISAAWYYQLSYGGNYIKCILGDINKPQLTDEILKYFQDNLFPANTPPSKV
jgi:hypothetical protein